MYISTYNPTHATLMSITSGKLGEAEWQAMYDNFLRLMENSLSTEHERLIMTIAQPDTERPNATWRRKFAELRNKNTKGVQSLSVIVTSSLLLRGVITTINWIVPYNNQEKIVAVDTFEEAVAWLRKETKKPLDYLEEMHRDCLAQLPKRSSAQ